MPRHTVVKVVQRMTRPVNPSPATIKGAAAVTHTREMQAALAREGLTLTTSAMDTIGTQGEGVYVSYDSCVG